MAKLLAIDGMALVRRIYEAAGVPAGGAPSAGVPAGGAPSAGAPSDPLAEAERAEQAFASMRASFTRLLQYQSPSHVLLAFDAPGPTWRHALFPAYKAHRPEMPPLLRQGLPEFYALLQSWGLQVLHIPGVEADDVIATGVLRWLREARGEAVIASSDKDLHCLIADGALLWDHFKNEAHDRHWVEQKFGVGPELLVDLLAFVGDAADNIPGVPKIGIKTAAKLLRAYGSLDGVMAGAGILSDAMGQRLRAGREQLYLSRQLLTLKTDVTLGVSWKTLVWATSH